MRAGLLDRVITINSVTTTVDAFGTQIETWAAFATMRAQLLQRSTDEFMLKDFGDDTKIIVAFRTRWLDGVTLAMQVAYNGATYRITEIKEIGRREALELRCLDITS